MSGRISGEDRLTVGILALVAVAVVLLLLALGGVFGGGTPDATPSSGSGEPGEAGSVTNGSDAEKQAAGFARTVLVQWSRPDVGYTEWWADLRDHLSPGGREAYAYTDPATVPSLADPEIVGVDLDAEGLTGTVWFETADGRYGVDVSRAEGQTWQAHRIVFPESRSMF